MITEAQAKVFRKLYVKTVNQDHVEAWARNLEHKQASPIIGKIRVLKRDLALSDPDTFTEIQNWGREQIKKLGYIERPTNPSL